MQSRHQRLINTIFYFNFTFVPGVAVEIWAMWGQWFGFGLMTKSLSNENLFCMVTTLIVEKKQTFFPHQ
jgi:hypothetical protein